jgi:tetratricopeptide (TPR) repeat protein
VLGEISPELMDPSALQPMADVSEPQALQSEASTEKEAGTLPWATPQAMPLIQQMPLDDVKAAEISAAKEKQPLRKAARKAAQGPTQEEVAIALAAIEEKQLPEISPAAKAKDDLLVVKSRPLIIEKKIIPATAKLDPVTSKLLNEIPAGTLEEKPLFTEEEVKVARVDVPSLEVDADAISQHEGTGIHIQVKKSGIKVDEYLRKARDGLNAGEFERAIAYYQAVLDSNKQNKHALFGLATSYHRSGELPLAKQYYQRLLQQDGGHKPALHNMMVLISQQSDGDSLPYLHELQAKNPTVAAIPAHIALIYARQVRYGDAIQKLQEAIRLAPEDASYHYHLAVILDNAGYHTEAIRAYQRVEKLYQNGANIPVAIMDIQQRLTFLLSNVPA